MTTEQDKIYTSSNLEDLNTDFLAQRLAEVSPAGPPLSAPPPAADLSRRAAELRSEMQTVNLGSPRMATLQASLEALLKQEYPEPTAADSEVRPAASTRARPADTARQQQAIYAELAKVNFGSPRAKELEASLERLLKEAHPDGSSEESSEPAAAADETGAGLDALAFRADTPEPVQQAYKASAAELGVPWSEAQAVLDRLQGARWLPADQFHATMRAAWGGAYENNLTRAARELETLPGPLKEYVDAHTADDTLFSPELARELVNLPTLRAQGRGR